MTSRIAPFAATYACLVACAPARASRPVTVIVPPPTHAEPAKPPAPVATAPQEPKRGPCDRPLPDGLKRAMGETANEARDCFYELLARDPDASGRILVFVRVEADGTVGLIRPV